MDRRSSWALLACITLSLVSPFTHSATPPALSSPNVTPESHLGPEYFGSVAGSGTVSAAGNAVYEIPIAVPPGTNGMQPNVSLMYNSNMRNGLMGLGWFFKGLDSKIRRCGSTFTQDGEVKAVEFNSQDKLCLDGQRLIVVSGSYNGPGAHYRTEVDSFQRIITNGSVGGGPDSFTVQKPNGHTYYYGHTADSKIEIEGRSAVRVWALNRIVDTAGNYIDFVYEEDNVNGEYRPTEIHWTGNINNGMQPNAKMVLNYENRPDKRVWYRGGAIVTDFSKRVEEVTLYVDNVVTWSYKLEYEPFGVNASTSPTGNFSRLKSVERCEDDSPSGGICQEPILIDWWATQNGTPFTAGSMMVPSDTTNPNQKSDLPRWHDLNGDGLADYIHTRQGGQNDSYIIGEYDVMLSDGTGGYTSSVWTTDPYIPDFNKESWVTWADINGDGRADMIVAQPDSGTTDFKVALSTGSGFNVQTWSGYPNHDGTNDLSADHFFYDMDGDKDLDLVVVDHDERWTQWGSRCGINDNYEQNIFTVKVALNDGSDFGVLSTWLSNLNHNVDLVDMDGNGLVDVVESANRVYYNYGSGYDPTPYTGFVNHSPPLSCFEYEHIDYFFHDFNGDGLADMHASGTLYFNTGWNYLQQGGIGLLPAYNLIGDENRHWQYLSVAGPAGSKYTKVMAAFNRDYYGGQNKSQTIESNSNRYYRFHQVVDIDGNGIQDIVGKDRVSCGSNKSCETDTLHYWQGDNPPHNLIQKITSGLGVEIEFTYKPLTDSSIYTKGTGGTLPIEDVQDSTHVVTTFAQSDGLGGDVTINYLYEGLKRDHGGRGLLGYAKITAENVTTDTTIVTEYEQTFPYASQAKHIEVRRTSDDRLLKETDITYSTHGDAGLGTLFPYVDLKVEKSYALESGVLMSTTTTDNQQPDVYGAISDTSVTVVDHLNASEHKKEVASIITHDVYGYGWRVGLVDSVVEKHYLNAVHDASLDKHTEFTYYPLNNRLHETTRESGQGSELELKTTLTYDAWGNVETETVSGPGITSRTSTTTYDARGQFPITIENALNHAVTQTWDSAFGVMTTQTDANSQTTTWEHDVFGRQWKETRPDSTTTVQKLYLDNAGSLLNSVLYSETVSTGAPIVRSFHDLLGRELRKRSQGFDGQYINVDTEYDSRGRAFRVSEPYFDGDTVYWNTTTFDHLNRPTSLTSADPAQDWTRTYHEQTSTITNANLETSSQRVNAVGQVIWVEDEAGTEAGFTYDAAGNRIEVTNDLGGALENSVTYTYDRLGRQLTQDDPDHGLYTYTYDALGQVTKEVSPKLLASSDDITYTYDLLGRKKTRVDPDGTTTWAYDDTTNGNLGVGKLHTETLGSFSKQYRYGSSDYGRLTSTITTIDGTSYTSSISYTADGKPHTETYPSGYAVENTYNPLGFLERVQDVGGAAVHYQLLDTDAAGRRTQEWLGDGSTTTLTYEGQSSRLTGQHAVIGSTDIQHFTYTYNDIGSMLTRSDQIHTLTETFTYDSRDRLTSATVTGSSAVSYDFNDIGNMTLKSDLGDPLQYNHASAIHAITGVTNGGTTDLINYDLNGNLKDGDDVPTITWSSFNKPTQLTKGGITYNFEYGPDRLRYKRLKGSQKIEYVNGHYEYASDVWVSAERHAIRAYGRAIMYRHTWLGTPTNLYLHRDHLGSLTAKTDNTGAVVERFSYDAWGARRDATDWVSVATATGESRGYTGHEHLDDIGVIHMNGRIYSPVLGRMFSPDPVTQTPENGQNYNRYSYVYNNPLKFSDPSGYRCWYNSRSDYVQWVDPRGEPLGGFPDHYEWIPRLESQCKDHPKYYRGPSFLDPSRSTNWIDFDFSRLKTRPIFSLGDHFPARYPEAIEVRQIVDGNLGDMWLNRCLGGDPIGCVGAGVWTDEKVLRNALEPFDEISAGRLINVGNLVKFAVYLGFVSRDEMLQEVVTGQAKQYLQDLESEVLHMAQVIALEHLTWTADDQTGKPHFLSALEITEYHHAVFEQFGIDPGFYGGSPGFGIHVTAFEGFYCYPYSCDSR